MLVISRHPGETVLIRDGDVTVTVTVLRVTRTPQQKSADVMIGEPGSVRFVTLSFDRPEQVSRTLRVVMTDVRPDLVRLGFSGDRATPLWRAEALIAGVGVSKKS